jgi:mercuric ion transport protein
MAMMTRDMGGAVPSARTEVATRDRRTRLAISGGALAALGAASCCVVPFALFALGISGAWIGNLTALAPYL